MGRITCLCVLATMRSRTRCKKNDDVFSPDFHNIIIFASRALVRYRRARSEGCPGKPGLPGARARADRIQSPTHFVTYSEPLAVTGLTTPAKNRVLTRVDGPPLWLRPKITLPGSATRVARCLTRSWSRSRVVLARHNRAVGQARGKASCRVVSGVDFAGVRGSLPMRPSTASGRPNRA